MQIGFGIISNKAGTGELSNADAGDDTCECDGDAVARPACVSGVITASMSPNMLAKGRPVATIGAPVTGVSQVGVPISTVCAVTPNMNDFF